MTRTARARTTPDAPDLEGRDVLESVGAALSDALLSTDSAGRVRSVNDEACRLLGLTPAWALGRPGAEVLRTAVPGEDLFAEAASARLPPRPRPGRSRTCWS